MPRRNSGDAWLIGPNGEEVWGPYGAAGLLLFHHSGFVLLQHRAPWTSHGNTWGLPGGSRNSRETAKHAALRESSEETGLPRDEVTIHLEYKMDLGWWSYTTVVGSIQKMFTPIPDEESLDVRWVPIESVAEMDLHPSFGETWPKLREALEAYI